MTRGKTTTYEDAATRRTRDSLMAYTSAAVNSQAIFTVYNLTVHGLWHGRGSRNSTTV